MVTFVNTYLYKLPYTQRCLFKFGNRMVPQKANFNLWVAECRSHYLSKKHSSATYRCSLTFTDGKIKT